ncbi:MAG TPA: hypothetical protein PKM73_02090 [Verrucomicrobiota bacterium]|nr:hypothetical protein [Verrucomicrobiota bacterium]HNU50342.1 hypothetical protein [Verrucomicrobiota bacterium]
MVDPEAASVREPAQDSPRSWPPAGRVMLLAAMAGALGWGIRGQYGHETGAMIAGLLVSLVLVLQLCPRAASLPAARAVAWCTVAIGFGGSMTYGQTVGLTHDPALVGRWDALAWGMLGLSIKGALWIGFAGLFLGMGLGGVAYRPRELLALCLVLVPLAALGMFCLNQPYDPAHKILPSIYFSSDCRWQPGADLEPRRERWGGLLFALLAAVAYVRYARRDRLAARLAGWGLLAGGLGFPAGQAVQAWHAWNLDLFQDGWLHTVAPVINWWNFMETTFGAVLGAVLGLGLWRNRDRIAELAPAPGASWSPWVEGILLLAQAGVLVFSEFVPIRWIEAVAESGLTLGIIPIVAVAGGRWWPYGAVLPLTMLPIAAKTLRELGSKAQALPLAAAWMLYLVVPLLVTAGAAAVLARRAARGGGGSDFARSALLLAVWLYFGLNFAVFQFPWPWAPWTARTPNMLVFLVCALGLTVAALRTPRSGREGEGNQGPAVWPADPVP